MKHYDIVIIGSGPSGMTAALYALRNNKRVLILEKEAVGGQIATSPRLENYPTIESISGEQWADRVFTQIDKLGVEFELEEVLEVKKDGKLFIVRTNYNEYSSYTVIIANGVEPRKFGLPNEDEFVGKGVSFCAVCDGPFYKDNEIYLIGDANTALQYALILASYCPKVHIMTLFDKFFGDQILIDRVKNKENIDITHNVSLVSLDGHKELESITFENTKTKVRKTYPTNNVFIAIGQVPHNEIFSNLITLDKGFIVTNEEMETGVPGLYAVGDTRKKDMKQVITACNDGAIAATNAVKYINNL